MLLRVCAVRGVGGVHVFQCFAMRACLCWCALSSAQCMRWLLSARHLWEHCIGLWSVERLERALMSVERRVRCVSQGAVCLSHRGRRMHIHTQPICRRVHAHTHTAYLQACAYAHTHTAYLQACACTYTHSLFAGVCMHMHTQPICRRVHAHTHTAYLQACAYAHA